MSNDKLPLGLKYYTDMDKVHHERVAIAAYYKAERRGFEPGHELEDWLEAEEENEVFRYI